MKYQKDDLSKFPDQIAYALAQYQPHGLEAQRFENIILSGLGGSGIAGRLAKSFMFGTSTLPIEVISDYELPHYAGAKTLAIMSSYSGNTEETLSMYAQAKARGCTVIAITTGGKLEEEASAAGYMIYKAQPGFQPRMALGYSLTYLQLIFGELFGRDTRAEMERAQKELLNADTFLARGKDFFSQFSSIFPKKVIVITDYFTNPIGLRFCQQIQENAKAEAFLHELPEANHNVIESYYGAMDSIIIFLNSSIHPRTSLRFGFLKELLEQEGNKVFSLDIDPKSMTDVLEKIYTLDFVSLYLSDQKQVNSSAIRNINALKDYLGKHS